MTNLITLSDIIAVTGYSDSALFGLIPYAQAQAEELLGYLEAVTKTYTFYITEETAREFELPEVNITSITSIVHQASAASDTTTLDTDEYRSIPSKGLIILDNNLTEGYTVVVTYVVGWTTSTVTTLVKAFLAVLTLNHYLSLFEGISSSSDIVVSEKIGDYTVKYADTTKGQSRKSIDEWADYLATLIRSGSSLPDIAKG